MKKLIGTFLLLSGIFMFSSCNKSSSTETIYNDNVASLEQIVTFFSNNKNVREITTDNPGLFYDYPYTNYDGIYYITQTKSIIQKNDETKKINQAIRDYFITIFHDKNEAVVIFQTIGELGYGEYIIYTETGNPYSDDTFFITKWLDTNWYIAKTN